MKGLRILLLIFVAGGIFVGTRLSQSEPSAGPVSPTGAPIGTAAPVVTTAPPVGPTATTAPIVTPAPVVTRKPVVTSQPVATHAAPTHTAAPVPTHTAIPIPTPTPCGYGWISVSAHVSYGSENTGIEIDGTLYGYNIVVRKVSVGAHTVRLLFPNNTQQTYNGAVADCKSWSIIYSS